MAEFDATGFSAVDEFFGDDGTKREELNGKHRGNGSARTSSQNNIKRKRMGVGSSKSVMTTNNKTVLENEAVKTRLLRIGGNNKDNNDYDNGDGKDAVDDNDDDDEEDAGRTGIATDTVSTPISVAFQSQTINQTTSTSSETTNGTKKLGKKERSRRMLEERITAVSGDQHPCTDSNSGETERGRDNSQKRKRKKVRSKQKNIRKDTRSDDAKPKHLQVGKFYGGRPLTAATRQKLNLPTPRLHPTVGDTFSKDREVPAVTAAATTITQEKKSTINTNNPKKKRRKFKNLAL